MYFIFLAFLLLLTACEDTSKPDNAYRFKPVGYAELPGWSAEAVIAARPALTASCQAWQRPTPPPLPADMFGTSSFWQNLCTDIAHTEDGDLTALLERRLQPLKLVSSNSLFTGYYQPLLEGSWEQTATYATPLLQKPLDLITANLAAFDASLTGQLIGRVENRTFIPYHPRANIQAADSQPLLWLKDPTDAFILHIQGSGTIQLPDGNRVHVAYAGNNGHTYTAIGKVLKEQGALTSPITMPKILAWLAENPARREEIFNQNARYIFFRTVSQPSPGTLGVPLTAEHSLAVDPTVIPLGLPVYLTTTHTATGQPFNALMLAQDTGSAITGPNRGDIFFGDSAQAETAAGAQAAPGQLFVLAPR